MNNNIEDIVDDIVSVIFSSPRGEQKNIKVRIFKDQNKDSSFFCESFTKTQTFHKNLTKEQCCVFIREHSGTSYKNTNIITTSETITILSNKKGKITTLRKPLKTWQNDVKTSQNKLKKYILAEGIPVPFLVHLGVMTEQGKVISSKYDKFRQINRFLEFIDDIIPKDEDSLDVYNVLDFGCGKSYLTFALYYFLVEIRKKRARITGIDLKEDVIKNCSSLAKAWGYDGLTFKIGRIEDYNEKKKDPLDLVITLHACDTATDYALHYAVTHNAKAILSVPCCQHEINARLSKKLPNKAFDALMKYGIVKERFASLATDVMRAELLESQGYAVQLMEFIAMEHTAKNVLIRAVKKDDKSAKSPSAEYTSLCEGLGVENTLAKLFLHI